MALGIRASASRKRAQGSGNAGLSDPDVDVEVARNLKENRYDPTMNTLDLH
jgi:hypothetical protein